jgi:hypothetical protein
MKTLLYIFFSFFFSSLTFGQQWLDNTCEIEDELTKEEYNSAKSNNILTLIIDQEGKLLVNGQKKDELSEILFKELVYDFLTNPSNEKTKADSPEKAIIALGSYGKRETYDLILKYVQEVYLYAWDTYSEEKYQSSYSDLDCKKREKVRKKEFHYNIIELNAEKKENKKRGLSMPAFSDVIDN